jgi:hypothetical protein
LPDITLESLIASLPLHQELGFWAGRQDLSVNQVACHKFFVDAAHYRRYTTKDALLLTFKDEDSRVKVRALSLNEKASMLNLFHLVVNLLYSTLNRYCLGLKEMEYFPVEYWG